MAAPGSLRGTAALTWGGGRGFHCRTSTTANITANTAMTRRALRCQRVTLFQTADCRFQIGSSFRLPKVSQSELDERLSIVLVLLQGEGDVDGGLVLGEVVVAFGGAPGNGAEDPAVL